MKKCALFLIIILFLHFFTAGCGETLSGVGKDIKRIGHGIKTVFVREE